MCGFRLYVEKENEAAHATYVSLGMRETDYLLYEELKPGIRVPFEPFLGVMGTALDEAGEFGTGPPRKNGGNADVRSSLPLGAVCVPCAENICCPADGSGGVTGETVVSSPG